ncbi:Coenzyme F420 hydrogenase/dehydrogenase, beta subunit C-terminal domain [Streptomyces sp. NPDC048410]|uniref:Coenzyme F420 hydrogenase/dehydrogenase, beta subunit C-terminal domain n=1 Tax=Streptomyces sp. NPDC048410 TaxID=3365545 RepID=UPI0037117492
MSFEQLAKDVLENALCTVCGACQLACPPGVIGFDGLNPVLTEPAWTESDCGTCGDCLDVCPGSDPQTPRSEERLFGRTRTPEERWTGIFSEVLAGHSLAPTVYESSASGGSLTTLLQTALLALDVDVVLSMGRDPDEPWRAAPAVVRDPAELTETAQSTYQLAPYLGALRQVMDEEPDARVALTGVACHIQAMRKLQGMDTGAGRWARDHVVLMLEPACSSSTRPEGTRSVIERRALVPAESVVRLRYREGDYPGDIAIRTDDGERHTVPFWQAVRDFAGNKTHRCLSCGDWMSGLADVSVSDGDPNIFAASVNRSEQTKHGRVFVRTGAGAEAVSAALAHRLLSVRPVELRGLNLGLERKRNRRASYEQADAVIPAGPIPGHREELDIVPDARWIAAPDGTDPDETAADRAARREGNE